MEHTECLICFTKATDFSKRVKTIITNCNHFFCQPCLLTWSKEMNGKKCPYCRQRIDNDWLHHEPDKCYTCKKWMNRTQGIRVDNQDPVDFEKIDSFVQYVNSRTYPHIAYYADSVWY